MRAILENLRGVFTTRRYTNPRLPSPLYLLTHCSTGSPVPQPAHAI